MSYWEIYLVLGVCWFLYEIADMFESPPTMAQFIRTPPARRLVMVFMNFGVCLIIWPLLFIVTFTLVVYNKTRPR
ncbi:hypothetical protein FCMLKIFP_00105 [Pseudomonas phage Ka3]|uniref:Uncharacterized protein n=1 Tax=Pseudomonas phage vB_Pae_AM.P2 TaxID=2731695 RepID=A0A7S5W9E3_9CAUD|nr:hypothetical protein AMP2_gp104 [Pseudomonas phage vB_Pae_AM.P2]QWY17790.1 hypothetical protein [Pseudomonas phage vB_Pae-PA152]UGL60917.1 hypothetical protein [Pseudomonas phage vB_PaeS_TUMS_P6]WQZ52455.1 hypothetical protein FCMLKIFP_00105 [Pseudomonas phage Ka3]